MRPRRQLTTQEAAAALGISHQAIGQWAAKPGAPVTRGAHGKAVLLWPDFARWRERALVAATRPARPVSMQDAELRFETARAEKMELELANMRAELVTVQDATAWFADACGRLRAKLLGLPRQVALRVTATALAEREAEARVVVDEVLAELAEGADVPPPAEA